MGRVVRCAVVFAVSCASVISAASAVADQDPVLTDAARAVVAGEVARSGARAVNSPAAREARERSRVAFRGLSPVEARQALLARHPSLASQPGWLTFPSLSPLADSTPLGPNLLSLDGGDRPDSVVLTNQPVAFRNRTGDLRKIDLGLERDGENDLVARSSPFELSVPDALDEGISIGAGDRQFSITPGASQDSEATVEQYAVFYGDVDPDTDFVVKPVLGGVETFSILRSPASPEELRLRFGGGAGSGLRPMGGEDGFVLSQGDDDLAAISPPQAWDAQHRPVAVETSIEGEELVLRVAHRGSDVAYPVVVDPTVIDTCAFFTSQGNGCQVDAWESSGDPTYNAGAYGWAYEGPADRFAPYVGPGYLGNGVYIRNLVQNYFWNGEAGDWYYRAPAGVRIYQAQFTNLSQDNTPDNATCLFAGVLGNTGNWEAGSPRTYCAQQSLDQAWWWAPTGNPYYRGGGTEGNAAVFGAMATHSGWSSYFMDHMGGVAIGLMEMSYGSLNPYISSPDFPDNWQTDPNRSITIHAGDAGLGIRTITFSSPENPQWQPIDADTGGTANKDYYACTGGTRLACPKDVWIRLKIGRLRQGYSTIRARVTDVVGKTYTYEHAIGISYYWASAQYGGGNGVLDSDSEVDSVVNAMAATSATGRQALWASLNPASRDYYVNNLLPDARQIRESFALDSSDATTRAVFNDPATHDKIAQYGTPMTSADWAVVSYEGPPSWVYDGPPAPDVLASTYRVSTDDGPSVPDSTENAGCDPSTETGCPDSATASTSALTTPSDPITDDLSAVTGTRSSEDAVTAGARSGGFDRYSARADADAHALRPRTGLFEPFADGAADCTNFVSQVWHLGGGLPMTRGWYIRHIRGVGLGSRSYSRTWPLTRDFVDYMVNKRQVARLITLNVTSYDLPASAAIADAIEYDWGTGHGWTHLSVVVATNTRFDNISQHSSNRRQSIWNLGWVNERNTSVRARMRARVLHLRAP